MIYGQGLFPFSSPVEVNEGDGVKLRLEARMIQDDYVWRWDTDFPKVNFKQSTFYGVPLSTSQLRHLIQKA